MSQLFTKTTKTSPADETSRGTAYLLRAGYVYKEMAGVYDFMPLGYRVLQNIIAIIREEMNSLGSQEIQMTALQSKELWEKTNRWSDEVMDIWFKTKLNAGGEVGLAPTHEEPITRLMRGFITSHKDLPVSAYQFQTKFRNELRAKSGILRTREFIMKDLYSFAKNREEHEEFYEQVAISYGRIFDRLGIGSDTFRTFASGGAFSKFSDEFQTLCEVGEDIIYVDRARGVAINEEVYNDETIKSLNLDQSRLEKLKAAEVGNIFTLGYRFSEGLDLAFNDENGARQLVFMGSYGIGPSRVMGVIAEKLSDDKGLIWRPEIAPYRYYLIGIGAEGIAAAAKIHAQAPELILLDDRDTRAGEKFADTDLLGIPYRVIISDKTLAVDQVEIKDRQTGNVKPLTLAEFTAKLS